MNTQIALQPGCPAPARRTPCSRLSGLREEQSFVKRLVRRFGVPTADIEDAAQDVFLISCRRHIDLDGGEDRHGWFHVAARYVCLNRRRSLRREGARRSFERQDLEATSADRALAPDELLVSRQLCRVLEDGLGRLSQEQRDVLVASALDGRTAAEIARELHAPVATVASRLRVGRQALGRHLHRHGWPLRPHAVAGYEARGVD